jgi:hypothetical protein
LIYAFALQGVAVIAAINAAHPFLRERESGEAHVSGR